MIASSNRAPTKEVHAEQPSLALPHNLARPAQRPLVNAGYVRLEQFTKISEAEIEQLHGIGPNALTQLRQALAAYGLSFADARSKNG
jgi:hypothetical protein